MDDESKEAMQTHKKFITSLEMLHLKIRKGNSGAKNVKIAKGNITSLKYTL